MTVVYTDGACLGNPGPGGWAWAEVGAGRWANGAAPVTTNQRMEVSAALEALRAVDGPVEVVSDSTYVVNCFRDRWWEGWIARGWRNSKKEPVANRDLWEPLVDLVRARGDVTFRWVKGHSGDPMNDLVDRLAVEAAQRQVGRSGVGPPQGLGEGDDVRERMEALADRDQASPPAEARQGPLPPVGRLVVVGGHRPPELGGYGENPVASAVRARLAEVLAAKRQLHDDLVVLTGLGLGAEQLGAEAAASAGVPYVGVLAFPEFDAAWPAETKARFAALAAGAASTLTLQRKPPETKPKVHGALSRRDAWLARHADEAVVVWDRRDGAVGRFVRSLIDRLGEEEVWVVDPSEVAG